MSTREAYICDAVRTPFGRYAGVLSGIRTDDLAAEPIKALIERARGVDWDNLDDVVLGNANQAGEDNRNVARMASLLAGLSEVVPGVTVNRLCGSGMQAVGDAARSIKTGESELIIAGGCESMSRAPYVISKSKQSFDRTQEVYDTTIGWRFINPIIDYKYGTDSLPKTAENIATEYKVSREDQDNFALNSQSKTANAIKNKLFANEIIDITIKQKDGSNKIVNYDEHPRPQTTLEKLARLPPVVNTNGTVTAGNASGVNDGACALLIASEKASRQYNLEPKARIIAMTAAGVPPRLMGLGPVPATRKILGITGLNISDMDVVEVNEAFAAQVIAVVRNLGVQEGAENLNPNGGAISLGHPLGASGARLIITATNELIRRKGRYALCTMCIGVGQGISMIIERL